ncbi:MFS transporter [Candidatus Fokinia solitaria]|nr:MFS transporter [Candidatus Fokinia solitaria]
MFLRHILILLSPLAFFGYQFILRLWPGLLLNHFISQFSIPIEQFGILNGAYYCGYSLMQIPIAMLLTKYHVRYILAFSVKMAGICFVIFTNTDSFLIAIITRFITGAASASAFLCVSKVAMEYFSPANYGKIIGWSFSIGLLGALYGGKPTVMLIECYGIGKVSSVLAITSIAISTLALFTLRKYKNTIDSTRGNQNVWKSLREMISLEIVVLSIANFLMVGALEGFADVWGVNYLMNAFDMEKGDAASIVSFIFMGMIFGGPILAMLGKKCGNINTVLCCAITLSLTFICLIFCSDLSPILLTVLFLLTGVACCYQVLVFAIGCAITHKDSHNIAIAFLNTTNMLGGFYFHTAIGYIIRFFSPANMHYTTYSYKCGIAIIPICAVISVFMLLLLRFSSLFKKAQYS